MHRSSQYGNALRLSYQQYGFPQFASHEELETSYDANYDSFLYNCVFVLRVVISDKYFEYFVDSNRLLRS